MTNYEETKKTGIHVVHIKTQSWNRDGSLRRTKIFVQTKSNKSEELTPAMVHQKTRSS